ncbi:MAG: asparagine synthase (glutamine-hydrolyzing) [Lachnospiraceae bacterium]|nr:asparagine synthase (glutamine-hydrolyzing) [Lachnospiraceae bacterium]
MCGIFGLVNGKIDKDTAEKCLNTLIHRGPDAGRIWQDLDKGITLGHRRLAILDLSEKGTQPMSYMGGKYQLIFNGEIYNFLEIRDELISCGYVFESESDSEVLLAAYDKWQEKCLNKFNGMWAFAIWDRDKERLFVSRDRFGIKPFYYCVLNDSNNEIVFASEMKAIMPVMKNIEVNRDIVTNRQRIVYYESTEECVIKGIKKLPAGSYGYIDKNGIEIKKFYNTLSNLISAPEKYEDQVEYMRELFLDACKLRMRSDVTIGTALSGGLDSSATICSMAHLSKTESDLRMNHDWQHAYVASFPGTTMDETKYAKAVTDYLGINSTFVEIDPKKSIDKLDEYIYLFEDVYLTSPIPMMQLYGALRADGTIVTIDGHGADELFGGYTFDFLNAYADAKTKEEEDLIATTYIESFPDDDSNMALKSRNKSDIKKLYMKRTFKKKLRGMLHREADFMKVRAAGDENYKKLDNLNKVLYASSHENILPTLLRNYDRYSMANSIEIRMPFMDYRIVEFAMSIGWKSKLHGGYSKSIIRDALAPFMPEEIAYRRTKIGFNTPIVEWMQGPLKEYFEDMISGTDFANCDLINPDKVRAEVLNVINNKQATFIDGEEAWSDLYPYLWERNFLKYGK